MDDTLYLVTCDGHTGGYGSEIFLIGIFDTEEQANAAANRVNLDINSILRNKYNDWDDQNYCRVTLAGKNIAHSMLSGPGSWWDEFGNDKYLGGYCE